MHNSQPFDIVLFYKIASSSPIVVVSLLLQILTDLVISKVYKYRKIGILYTFFGIGGGGGNMLPVFGS